MGSVTTFIPGFKQFLPRTLAIAVSWGGRAVPSVMELGLQPDYLRQRLEFLLEV